MYKGEVPIPPLSMVDDVICITECGYKSVMVNSFLQAKTSMKKLQFGSSKCKKIHIGKKCENYKCHQLYVDKWDEVHDISKDDTKTQDVLLGKVLMEESNEEKYLGDLISKDGKNIKNIKSRVNKGKMVIKRIMDVLEAIPFGKLYFEVAILLRNSLFVSSILCNSEVWFNLNQSDLNLIESVDLSLLRRILGAPKYTPKEMLYLELGLIPLREEIRKRRLNFLKYILDQDGDSILFKVFDQQCKNTTKNDWVTTIIEDMRVTNLNVTFADIQEINKMKWRSIIKQHIREKSLRDLNKIKEGHSKVKDLKHIKLATQDRTSIRLRPAQQFTMKY